MRTYGTQYVLNSPDNQALMKLFHDTCEQRGIRHSTQEIFEYLSSFEEKQSGEQLVLPFL